MIKLKYQQILLKYAVVLKSRPVLLDLMCAKKTLSTGFFFHLNCS